MSERIDKLIAHMAVTRKGAERVVAIVEAGVGILREEGFMALTKRRIATRLGISHGNVSYYFATRESLWKAVIDYELKSYYERHYSDFSAEEDDAQGRFNEFLLRWVDEYRDRDMRIFFSQMLAFAEVSPVIAAMRNNIYETFYDETLARVRALLPDVSDDVLQPRVLLIIAALEGLHAVTSFRPRLTVDDSAFRDELVSRINSIARGTGSQ
ncbi:MAG: TetR/AcrR family transcriptional regulator [Halioglobus sp.]|nr:TetR/AcrR family transcriptional regulator [Halioglobus sp.]